MILINLIILLHKVKKTMILNLNQLLTHLVEKQVPTMTLPPPKSTVLFFSIEIQLLSESRGKDHLRSHYFSKNVQDFLLICLLKSPLDAFPSGHKSWTLTFTSSEVSQLLLETTESIWLQSFSFWNHFFGYNVLTLMDII